MIGLAAFAFAAVALYFSASPAITLFTRAESRVDCEVTAKMLNLFVVDTARVSGVREVLMIASATGRSRTPPHLNFRTDAGDVNLGYFSQRFAGEWKTARYLRAGIIRSRSDDGNRRDLPERGRIRRGALSRALRRRGHRLAVWRTVWSKRL